MATALSDRFFGEIMVGVAVALACAIAFWRFWGAAFYPEAVSLGVSATLCQYTVRMLFTNFVLARVGVLAPGRPYFAAFGEAPGGRSFMMAFVFLAILVTVGLTYMLHLPFGVYQGVYSEPSGYGGWWWMAMGFVWAAGFSLAAVRWAFRSKVDSGPTGQLDFQPGDQVSADDASLLDWADGSEQNMDDQNLRQPRKSGKGMWVAISILLTVSMLSMLYLLYISTTRVLTNNEIVMLTTVMFGSSISASWIFHQR